MRADQIEALEDVMGLVEAARYLGLSRSTLRDAAAKGTLPAKRIGRDWVTNRAACDHYRFFYKREM